MLDLIRDHLDRGEWVQAAAVARGLYFVEDTPVQEEREAAYLAAEAMHRLRQFAGAAEMAERAKAVTESIPDTNLLGRALYRLCGSLVACSGYHDAIKAGDTFVEGLSSLWPELESMRGRCLINIGMAHKGRRMYPDALAYLTEALPHLARFDGEKAEEATDHLGYIVARHLMAWILCDMDAPDEAEQHLRFTKDLVPLVPSMAEHQIAHMAYLRLKQGAYDEAELLAGELTGPRREVGLANQAIAYYVKGCLLLHRGELDFARDFCEEGLKLALQSHVPAVMNLFSALRRDLAARTE